MIRSVIILIVGIPGYIHHKSSVSGNILNSYESTVVLMVIKISYNVYTAFSRAPVTRIRFIEELERLIPQVSGSYFKNAAMIVFIGGAFVISVFIPDLVFVLAIVNATFVTIRLYIIPAIIYIIVKNNPKYEKEDCNSNWTWKEKYLYNRKWLAWIIILGSFTISVIALSKNKRTT